jgi:hypothetical protein
MDRFTDLHIFVGYGFPTTFGLIVAAVLSVTGIQLLVLRDRRRKLGMMTDSASRI